MSAVRVSCLAATICLATLATAAEFRRAPARPELRKENGTGRRKKSRRSWRLEVRNREVSKSRRWLDTTLMIEKP
jgi:hypothetical protein